MTKFTPLHVLLYVLMLALPVAKVGYDTYQQYLDVEYLTAKVVTNTNDLIPAVSGMARSVLDIDDQMTYLADAVAHVTSIRVEKTGKVVKHTDLDVFCLAKNIFHEASIEDELGMYAVAQVTMNRLHHIGFPDSICGVVYQPMQFSWTIDKTIHWTHPTGWSWTKAKEIARLVIREGHRVPALQTATLYHADYIKRPRWRNVTPITKIGTHIFYETRETL